MGSGPLKIIVRRLLDSKFGDSEASAEPYKPQSARRRAVKGQMRPHSPWPWVDWLPRVGDVEDLAGLVVSMAY